jgi:hypothetical protein
MPKKQTVKPPMKPSQPTDAPPAVRRFTPLHIVAAVLVVASIAVFVVARSAPVPSDARPDASVQSPADTPAAASPMQSAATPAEVPAAAALGPHHQANLPPLHFPGYAPTRPPEVIKAVYQFAAEHPEILSYVPCYCGCEHSGHRGNEDCFVRARSVDGDVVEWEDHGMECAVCIDVAQRSMQMYSSGASVHDIRAAIEKEWNPRSPTHTPTPAPPAK